MVVHFRDFENTFVTIRGQVFIPGVRMFKQKINFQFEVTMNCKSYKSVYLFIATCLISMVHEKLRRDFDVTC